MCRLFSFFLFGVVGFLFANAQINVLPGTTYFQNFDVIGTSANATLPSGWKVAKYNSRVRAVNPFDSASTQTEQRAGNNMPPNATNGIYNFGAGDAATATDRAVGGLSSSDKSKSVNLYVQFFNNSSSDITSLNVIFDVEKYRKGLNSNGFRIQLFYSLDGVTWDSVLTLRKVFPADADNNGYATAPGVVETVSGTINVVVPPNQYIYLAWNYSVTSSSTTSNAQALGIDNVSVEFIGSPQLIVNPSSLSGLNYLVGNGPSSSQVFMVSGSNLSPANGNVSITSPTNFEISLDNVNFSNSLTLPYSSSTLSLTQVYVRLKAGLSLGFYSGNVVVSGGGAANQTVAVSGSVNTVSSFSSGDIAILSVCSNINCVGGGNGEDEISFITFRDINPGDEFIITDNGYQRVNPGKWGNSEGTFKIVRTGTSTIAAGTVITMRLLLSNPFVSIFSPDNDWFVTNLNWPGTSLVLNENGDQIYFFQGGTWNKGTNNGSHDATYTPGTLLFAFNTNNQWLNFGGNTQHSGLFPGMECFSMMPGVATDFLEYTGPTTPATKREWIDRINNPSNWTNRGSCATYFANRIHYGKTYTVLPGGYSPGVWLGSKDNNWFNCENWQNLMIPDSLTDVTIPSTGVTNEPTIGAPPTAPVAYTAAYSRNISIENGRTLTMNNAASRLDVYGNFTNNGTLAFTNGTVYFRGTNTTLSGSNLQFYNVILEKKFATSTLTLNNNFTISNSLSLKKGLITTGSNMVVVSNTSTSAITDHSTQSYINGKLRRYVAATGSYDFPLGTSGYYELANINLNSSAGLSYIDGFFTNPHTTPINIISQNVYVNGTQLTELLNYGFWTFEPNGGTYNYDITLTSRGHTNEGLTASSHAIIKRPNAASNWVSQGTHLNSDQSMVSGVYVTARRRSLTSFSDFAIAKSSLGNLPVEFISFDVRQIRPSVVELTWSTASETNCALYEIELWQGGSYVKSLFHPGSGNTHEKTTYSLIDQEPAESTLYLLYQEDFDGKRHLLDAKWYEPSNEEIKVYIENHQLHIVNTRQEEQLFDLTIYDVLGKTLLKKDILLTQSQKISLEIPFSGMIFMSLKNKGEVIFEKKFLVD